MPKNSSEPTAVFEDVTPALAESYLRSNDKNRPLSASRLAAMSAVMRGGGWQNNGEAVIFSNSDKLLDGQHRLGAIVDSGVTQRILVVRGVEDEAFHTIDTGRIRRSSDILAIAGKKNPFALASSAAQLYRIIQATQTSAPIPPAYILEVTERYPQVAEWLTAWSAGPTIGRLLPASSFVPMAVYFDAIAQRPDIAQRVLDGIDTGANLADGDPLMALRNRLITYRSSLNRAGRATVRHFWGACCRTIDLIEAGQSASRIQMIENNSATLQPAKLREHLRELPESLSLFDLPDVSRTSSAESTAERIKPAIYRAQKAQRQSSARA